MKLVPWNHSLTNYGFSAIGEPTQFFAYTGMLAVDVSSYYT